VSRAGIAGLSLRVVAAEAAIPLSAVGYYFDSKDDLIRSAFDRHVQHETARVTRAITRMGESPSATDLADRLADFVISGLTETRMQMQAEYEFMIEGVRRPALATASAAWQAMLNIQFQAVMESLESPSPKTDARLILAVLAGLEVDQLATELQPSDARMIREVLRRLLLTLELAWRSGESVGGHPTSY
jgi:DNA-binding transcriptional regulator YbjK